MDVILLEKIRNLGNLGDKVRVKPGFGRNFLIPQKKAVAATAANTAAFEARRAELERNQADALGRAQARANQLNNAMISITARAGSEGRLFGSVGTVDIANALKALDAAVERREVRLPGGGLRVIGDHAVELHLHADVIASVTVRIVADGEAVAEPEPPAVAAPQ